MNNSANLSQKRVAAAKRGVLPSLPYSTQQALYRVLFHFVQIRLVQRPFATFSIRQAS
jgi:hypothetical protein